LADWFGLASLTFLVTMVLVAVHLRTGRTIARNLAMVGGLLWVGVLGRTLIQATQPVTRGGVVIVPEVVARSADAANAPARFPQPLPGGTEVSFVDDRDQWVRIRLSDGRQAWLPKSAVETI
jgi:hypothetical protein